ncbi:MAG TPA: hypothetical protein VGP15_02820 [Burkholderiales bacterium]|jgi:hypothetical protein|nr:hypothetical protein [Burkholderiales bacterium]
MDIFLYVFAGLFMLLAVGMVFTYTRKRHHGLLLMAAAYGGSAGAALALMEAWPLLAGLAVAWLVRMAGLDPDTSKR